MRKLEQVSTYYKGRLSIMDLVNMPADMYTCLYYFAWIKMSTEEGQKELEADATEDELEELVDR